MVLPCDDKQLREEVCGRKTYQVDAINGDRLHESVEQGLANFFSRDIDLQIKIEMLKLSILRENDWDVKLAFDELDSQD